MMVGDEPSDRLLRLTEVKSRVGLGKTKIYELIAEGQFPKPHRVTIRAVRWSERDIAKWLAGIVLPR